MKLRAASRSSSLSNATSRSGADPNMCRNDHSAKRLPRSNSGSASVDFAPQSKDVNVRFLSAQKRTFPSALSACGYCAMRWVRNQTVSGNDGRSDLGRKSLLRMRCLRRNLHQASLRRGDRRHIADGVRQVARRRLSRCRQTDRAGAVLICPLLQPAGLATDQG